MPENKLKKELTIKEVYAAKKLLETRLFETIKTFEEISGLVILDIDFTFEGEKEDFEDGEVNGIRLDVRLDNIYYDNLNKTKK